MKQGTVSIYPVHGLPEFREGDDLPSIIAAGLGAGGLADGDVVVVSSKIVSKAEGRIVHGVERTEAVRSETVRVVAQRGQTQIVQTRHGFVMAAAGVDNSNVALGSLVLLPLDPDASARSLRRALSERFGGVRIGVVVTDTFGRPWRLGQTDLAVGSAGVVALSEHRGKVDPYGNELAVTAPAYADELASAADLVKAKLAQVPVAVISGLGQLVTDADGPGVAALVRTGPDDMFALGTREAMRAAARLPRTVAALRDEPVDLDVVREVLAAFAVPGVTEIDDHQTRKPILDQYSLPSTCRLLTVDDADPVLLDRLKLGFAVESLGVLEVTSSLLAIGAPL
jgi:coenzyme F420-0:L-glutamate ligase/coenzyme F420-1:gamma-L-glutamate ligase